ncbi:hypothetical protein BRADI_4g04242v3 [Brachypodium distachyon]|uniref:Uncharacterized protein n=1 Tax=Brachypodium distachyon TaxID=15368 RepID=A0A2K2CKE0_BRADI|nr:hypothetical protein BRADI_4g04242v3 [Brachypodium distachyon]
MLRTLAQVKLPPLVGYIFANTTPRSAFIFLKRPWKQRPPPIFFSQ